MPREGPDRVVVRRFSTRHEAEIAQALLEGAGIVCALFADDAGGWYPAILTGSPARLVVRAEDAERAKDLLEGRGLRLVD